MSNASHILAVILGVTMGLLTGLYVGYGLAQRIERDAAVVAGVASYQWDERGREEFRYTK